MEINTQQKVIHKKQNIYAGFLQTQWFIEFPKVEWEPSFIRLLIWNSFQLVLGTIFTFTTKFCLVFLFFFMFCFLK